MMRSLGFTLLGTLAALVLSCDMGPNAHDAPILSDANVTEVGDKEEILGIPFAVVELVPTGDQLTAGKAWFNRDKGGEFFVSIRLYNADRGYHAVQLIDAGQCEPEDPSKVFNIGLMYVDSGSESFDILFADQPELRNSKNFLDWINRKSLVVRASADKTGGKHALEQPVIACGVISPSTPDIAH